MANNDCVRCGGDGNVPGRLGVDEAAQIPCPSCYPAECERCKGSGLVPAPLADHPPEYIPCPDCQLESGAHIRLRVTMIENYPSSAKWDRGGDGPVLVEVHVGPLRFRYFADAGAPNIASIEVMNVSESEFYRERLDGRYEEAPKPGGPNLPKCSECNQVLEAHIEHRCWTPEEAPK